MKEKIKQNTLEYTYIVHGRMKIWIGELYYEKERRINLHFVLTYFRTAGKKTQKFILILLK